MTKTLSWLSSMILIVSAPLSLMINNIKNKEVLIIKEKVNGFNLEKCLKILKTKIINFANKHPNLNTNQFFN